MNYRDFNIRIVGKNADGYDVRVESPAGSARARVPLDLNGLSEHVVGLGHTLRGSSAAREAQYDAPPAQGPSHIGAKLHDALLAGGVRTMYDRSVGEVLNDPDAGLRIKLHLDLDNPDLRPLAQLPWEFAYDPSSRDYLALSRQTPIVRYIDVPRRLNAYRLAGKLRILVVMSSPRGHAPLDLAKERALIESTWAGDERVEVNFLEHPTKASLLDTLVDKSYHVLHYMGHGAYDHNSGSGALVLEDGQGGADMLDAATFGTWLRDAPRLRLIVLNACDTGKAGPDQPFAGVANRLVMVGLPAVVAMQFPISDQAAIDFSRVFYGRLVEGFTVDEATTQGRKAIMAGPNGAVEWATPVLYMRAPDGRLFDMATQGSVAPDPERNADAVVYDTPTLAHSGFLVFAYNMLAVISAHRFVNFPDDVRLLGAVVVLISILFVAVYAGYVLYRSARSTHPLSNAMLALSISTLGLHLCLFTGGGADIYFSDSVVGDYTQTFTYGGGTVLIAAVFVALQLRGGLQLAQSLALPMASAIIFLHGLNLARHTSKVLQSWDWVTTADFAFGNLLQMTVGLGAIVLAAAYIFASIRFSDTRS